MSAATAPLDTKTFGRYQLIRRLATGGMGEVYLARAQGIQQFEKIVVLKTVLPEFAREDRFIDMFLEEARIAARLLHPNIAQVYDVGRAQDDRYFFTMEFVHGLDLRGVMKGWQKLGRRCLPAEVALTIGIRTASALHHAHELRLEDDRPSNLVHRDVSPSNILVSYDGTVKLVDFGVAKITGKRQQTQTGTRKGKVTYMSPEQCRGETLDRRSDVFALGIVIWELTTGLRLYDGDNDVAILFKICSKDPPPPSSFVPGYPAALEEIVMKALRRAPEDRYATAQDLQLALEQYACEAELPVSNVSLARLTRELGDPDAPVDVQEEMTAAGVDQTDRGSSQETSDTFSSDTQSPPTVSSPSAEVLTHSQAQRRGNLFLGAILVLLLVAGTAGGAWWLAIDSLQPGSVASDKSVPPPASSVPVALPPAREPPVAVAAPEPPVTATPSPPKKKTVRAKTKDAQSPPAFAPDENSPIVIER